MGNLSRIRGIVTGFGGWILGKRQRTFLSSQVETLFHEFLTKHTNSTVNISDLINFFSKVTKEIFAPGLYMVLSIKHPFQMNFMELLENAHHVYNSILPKIKLSLQISKRLIDEEINYFNSNNLRKKEILNTLNEEYEEYINCFQKI